MRYLFLLIFIFSSVILIRIIFIDLYIVPSASMEPTLISGDFILVSKHLCGPRILKIGKFYNKRIVEYTRLFSKENIGMNDVIVFNVPTLNARRESLYNPFGNVYVKRCVALPGDTLEILKNEELYSREKYVFKGRLNKQQQYLSQTKKNYTELFPHDTNYHWTIQKYGPLWIPQKKQNIKLSLKSYILYKNIIDYEKSYFKSTDSSYINSNVIESYAFKFNYYFMQGDNFFGSRDSRFWGFVPETHIIGKAVLVLFSIDPHVPWYRCFRWKRLFKKIK